MPKLTSKLRSLIHTLRALPAQMDWFRGLRAAIALTSPLFLGHFTHNHYFGWAALGGIEAIISDPGGPYRVRLRRLALLSIGGAFGCALGTYFGVDLRWALPVVLLFCFCWSYLGALGQSISSAALLVQVIFACGIGEPEASAHVALLRGAFILGGGLWAMALSLVLWPIDPYRPGREAVAQCYQELAASLIAIRQVYQRHEHQAEPWHQVARDHQSKIRKLLESAWHTVSNIHIENLAESTQGRNLVVLLEMADLLVVRTIAIAEQVEMIDERLESPTLGKLGSVGIDALIAAEKWVATQLTHRLEIHNSDQIDAAQALRQQLAQLPQQLRSTLRAHQGSEEFLLLQITESTSLLETAVESVASLRFDAPTLVPLSPEPELRRSITESSQWDALRSNLRWDSIYLRHALRVAMVSGINIIIIHTTKVDHGYWLLLTSMIVLQPYISQTLSKGFDRSLGTVAGGIFAALLALTIHSQLSTGFVLFPLALFALALMRINYVAYSFFLTPAFVLAFIPHQGDWQLAFLRISNTLAGAAIAIAAMVLLFPSFERRRIPTYLEASLLANLNYLDRLRESWESTENAPALSKQDLSKQQLLKLARRATGLAHNNTEESLDRLRSEHLRRTSESAEAALAMATYLRRFAQSITTLTTIEKDCAWKQSNPTLERLERIHNQLKWMLESVRQSKAPLKPWPENANTENALRNTPDDKAYPDTHPAQHQLLRLERQSRVLHRHLETLRQLGGLN